MALPFLPGNSFNKNLGKTKYHKSHHFDISNEVSMLVGEAKPGIGGERLPFQKRPPPNSYIPRGQGTDLPSWVAFDKQVLSFDAFYQEPVHEKREEQYRVHSCKIYFYLEDDSIQVVEPRAKNAGLPQGTIIRRHRIARPPPCDNTFFTVEDFNIGKELVFYGKTFKITDLDPFTRNFLTKLGVRLHNPSSVPTDPYMTHRKALDESMQPLRPYEKQDTLKQFIDHDRHVLRFFCYWDDKENMFGDNRYLVLHYFLADDTIEILERVPANAGRDAVPMFLRRGKLPKAVSSMLKPGEKTNRTVLNVFGPMQMGGRFILDSLKTGSVHEEFYKCSDLSIGAILNVWGRKVVLCDCDEFTREYYKTKFGVTEMTPIPYMDNSRAPKIKETPPYNGFGSEEDSLCSCQGLMPSPPRRDFIKFMEKDRRGLESNVLRFLGRMVTSKPIDQSRRFIISYFLSDDTILVFEPPVRNSGIIGGKFLERGRIKKPGQERYRVELSEYYTARDLHVGARIMINNFPFELVDADEYCYRYMEKNSHEFPSADIGRAMEKLAGAIGDVSKAESMQQYCDFRRFAEIIQEKAPGALNEQELRTVARFYQDRRNETLTTETMQSIVQDHLRRHNFEGFIPFYDQCVHHDSTRCGRVTPTTINTVAQALHMKIPNDLLRGFIGRLVGEDGLVDYTDFVHRLNWRDAAVPPPNVPIELASEWRGTTNNNALDTINFGLLMKDLGGPTPPTEDEKVDMNN